jgi:hypothetical protein
MARSLLPKLCLLIGLSASLPARAEEPPPFYASLPRPKVLFIADSTALEATADYWRSALPAAMSFLPLFYGEPDFHHLCDKALEEGPEDIGAGRMATAERLDLRPARRRARRERQR